MSNLPIKELYADLVQPPARRIGKAVEDTLKFVALPFSFLGMTAEELEKKYREFISTALNKVPEEKREKPSPLIAGPLFEHVKYLFDDKNEKTLEDMFSELLKNACNKDTKKYVQPSYVYNLKQLTWVEAKILQLLYSEVDEYDRLGIVFKKLSNISESTISVYSKEAEPLYESEDEEYSNVFFKYYYIVIEDNLEISVSEFRTHLNILEQLNLIERCKINKYRDQNKYSLDAMDEAHADKFDPYGQLEGFSLTGYALDMMELCMPEREKDSFYE